ncbi:MFS transporter [Psychrobacillus sp. NPDC096426]|uniref:MFS transporter n=1 Tax=Psychrobacillus sp. NPDC096426 TaxID=3364491 RepID=UPI0037F2AF65
MILKSNESLIEESADNRTRTRALFASAIGSAIEWYDFFLYGTMSALVFQTLFFPNNDPYVSLMLSYASFGLAFLVRPIGGVLFSHIGDRIGRKKTLIITLSIMGGSTVLMGLLPNYNTVGIWAPILLILLRLLQGLSLGGEWGGGLLLAVEYAPKNKRGFYGSIPQIGAMIGLSLASLSASLLTNLLSEEAFLSYGWRIPFLLSIVLVLTGLWIRKGIGETPSFQKVVSSGETVKVPLFETLTKHWRAVLTTIGAKFIETSTFFIFATFTISYAVDTVGYDRQTALNGILYAALLAIPVMMIVGSISDRIGRKKMFIAGIISMFLYAIPYFWILSFKTPFALTIAIIIGFAIIWPMYGAILGTLFAESFSANVRYTGVSLGYQVGAALVGGPAPLIATALLVKYNNNYIPIAIFIMLAAVVSLIAILCTREKKGRDLDE